MPLETPTECVPCQVEVIGDLKRAVRSSSQSFGQHAAVQVDQRLATLRPHRGEIDAMPHLRMVSQFCEYHPAVRMSHQHNGFIDRVEQLAT